jgi:SAM-dependent methyltransferase
MSKKSKDSKAGQSIIKNHLTGDIYEQVENLFAKVKKGDEFEFIFFSKKGKYLPQQNYINLLKYFNVRADTDKEVTVVGPIDMLDINLRQDSTTTIRSTISGSTNINTYMKKVSLFRSHVIMGTFVKLWEKGDTNLTFMKKTKENDQTIDVDDIDMRARLSKEDELAKSDIENVKSLDNTRIMDINYRYKQRTSLFVVGNEKSDEYIRIDLTFTRSTDDFKKVNRAVPNYELEIEYGTKTKSNPEMLTKMFNETVYLLKLIQQSNFIITNPTIQNVLAAYNEILSNDNKSNALNGRQPISLEIQHITEVLPNKYAVTDKADGDRYFLMIHENNVYLISNNLNVRFTGIVLSAELSKYNGTVLDGEYIFLADKNKHMFLAFDCLFFCSEDVRQTINLFDRLKYADEVIEKCFIFSEQTGYKTTDKLPSKFSVDGYCDFYTEDLVKYVAALNHDIDVKNNYPLIRRKYFIGCTGAKDWEIFAYSVLMWYAYTTNPKIKCPYLLDGLVYQPLEQAYVSNASESQKSDYKWKPPTKNSIDFYIEFEKDRDTGKILTVYDNSHDDYVRNKSYRICNLYVGQKVGKVEQPVLFKQEQELYMAYLFLEDGEIRDVDGDCLFDKTVVEFYYNDDPDVPERFKWVPIRTRHDKTESVARFGKRYGNYISVADKVWRSIKNPVLMSDLEDLAIGNDSNKNAYMYDKKIEALRKKIGHELIISATKENVYYQQRSKIAQPMRQFHNWIKSNLIYTFCHPMYQSNKQLSILDLACGRGGDIMKFYYAMAAFYVGVDIDKEGLVSAVDGAVSRYNQLRRKPNFPKMYFIQGDAGALLNSDDQTRALNGMDNANRQLMDKFFSKDEKKRTLFDRINCQFAIHYMFKNAVTLGCFKQNLNMYLRNGGYLLATTFDGQKIAELLGTKDKYTSEYTDENGKKKILFEIIKKYDVDADKGIMGTGHAIDVYMAWICLEGRYLTEYLVDKRFIEKEFLDSCDLELVDTDNFGNQLNIHRNYFEEYAKYEEIDETRQFLAKVGGFYKTNEVNEGCTVYNSLMRYYVFRKKDGSKTSQSKQKGGNDSETKYDFSDLSQFKVASMEEYNNDYSYFNSIHQLMRSHKIIPKHVKPDEMYGDFGIKIIDDKDLKPSDIRTMAQKISISHTVKSESNVVIDGLNVFVVERDCNDDYDIDFYGKAKSSKRAIILMKEGDLYLPIYHIESDGRKKGLFKMSDPLVGWMLENV